jgi:polar amino acid transport system substrate-binding protein
VRALALLGLAFFLSGCGGSDDDAGGDPSADKLAQVLSRGTLVLFTDPEYPPQSFAVEGAARSADTKCAADELTGPEIDGYDADTGKLVAEALGVEPCFVTPSWTEVTAGNWDDRWDLAYGSGAIALDRMEVLYVTRPYYATPNVFFVGEGSTAQEPADLSRKRVGACAGCTMEEYLRGTLELPGPAIESVVEDPEIVTFETEPPGLEATDRGDLDAFLCSEPVGIEAIAGGATLRQLETPAYLTYKTGYVDKSSGLDVGPFVERVNEIVEELHASGELRDLSLEYFEKDYATLAAEFDFASIDQTVT